MIRAWSPASPAVLSYLLGITTLLSGCAAAPPAPPQKPATAELDRLRAENRELQQRIDELEADRDRLRAKVAPAEKLADQAASAPAEGDEVERLPSVSGLPVVKLVPSPKASGSEVMEVEEVEQRPVLRVHGEEEGALVTDDQRRRGKGKS